MNKLSMKMPVSKTLKKILGGLNKIISETDPKKRLELLETAAKKDNVLRSIKEISRNVVLKNVPLTARQKKLLVNHSKCIVGCSKIKGCCKRSSKLVKQSGGWLQVVLPIIASLIANKFL